MYLEWFSCSALLAFADVVNPAEQVNGTVYRDIANEGHSVSGSMESKKRGDKFLVT